VSSANACTVANLKTRAQEKPVQQMRGGRRWHRRCYIESQKEIRMKYGIAWLVGVPFSVIVLWFAANQMGCGL
jgi:hypothetical protein